MPKNMNIIKTTWPVALVAVMVFGFSSLTPTIASAASLSCPISVPAGAVKVTFATNDGPNSSWLLSPSGTTPVYSVGLSAGNYKVSLAYFDDHPNDDDQLHEQYYVSFLNGTSVVRNSNATRDLPQSQTLGFGVVNASLNLPSNVNGIRGVHAYNFSDSTSNSILPVCAVFERLADPTPAPTVDIKANGSDGPLSVTTADNVNLTWTSQNATSCSASGSWSGVKLTSGSEPRGTSGAGFYTYVINCAGATGSISDSVSVNVSQVSVPLPTVTINASPNPVNSGNQTNLTWTSTNAASCVAGGGWSGAKQTGSNRTEVSPSLTQATTFTITCQNSVGQSATDSVTVGVNNNINAGGGSYQYPPTLNLYANPSQVPAGNTSTLYWSTTNANSCIASGDWNGNKIVSGSQIVGPINNTQNYILTCYGPGGSVVRNTTVSPVGQVLGAAAPILTIYAIPTPVRYGSASTVYWNSSNVDFCNASADPAYFGTDWYGSKPTNGQYPTGPLFADKTYTLTCYGQGGTITRSAVVPVIRPVYTYVPPVVTTGVVQGASIVSGSYGAAIEKTIENLATGAKGSSVNARPGNQLRYIITVRNTGTLTLRNLVVKDKLTDKVEIVEASDNAVYDYSNRTVTWKIGTLGAGAEKTLTLLVRVVMCDSDVVIENRATVDNNQISEVTSNNTVAGVSAGPFTVTIDNPAPVIVPGDKVTYTIHYRNDSGSTVRGATLDVYIPTGMIIEGYSQTCTVSGNTVKLSIGDVASGQSGQVQVIGKIDKSVLDDEQLITRATLGYNDATNVHRESSVTTVSTVNTDENTNTVGVSDKSDKDAEFAAAAKEGTSRGLSFLPDTFFGWLLLLLLIIIAAIFVKRLLTKD